MAWQEVTPINAKTAKGLVAYTYSLKFGARILVPASVAQVLKWKPLTNVKLFVGGGEHTGKLRLIADPGGPLIVRASKGDGFQVHIGKIEQLPAREVKRATVHHEVDGSAALMIALPTHAQAVAPSPRPSASIMDKPVPTLSGGGKTSVNDRFFNDPKPRPVAMASGVRGQR